MTKEAYFDMCDMLGSEPIASEIPIEYGDLPLDVQEAYSVYTRMPDTWDTVSGLYIGKNYTGLLDIFRIMGVEDEKLVLDIIILIDQARREVINKSKPKNPS